MVKVLSTGFETIAWQANNITKSMDKWISVGQIKQISNFDKTGQWINSILHTCCRWDKHFKREIDMMKKLKWYSFDQYKAKAFNVWRVTLPVDKLKWLDGLCNCPAFFKKFLCKHVVDVSIRLNYCKPLTAAKHIKIGKKCRRDRPSTAKKALLIH